MRPPAGSGELWAFGNNGNGELGIGATPKPRQVRSGGPTRQLDPDPPGPMPPRPRPQALPNLTLTPQVLCHLDPDPKPCPT